MMLLAFPLSTVIVHLAKTAESQLVQSCPIVGGITMNAATGDSYFLLPNISQIRCTWTFSTWKPVWGSSLTWDISVSSKSGTITVKENRPGNRSLVECSSQSGESEPLHEVCLCRTRAAAACPGPAGRGPGAGLLPGDKAVAGGRGTPAICKSRGGTEACGVCASWSEFCWCGVFPQNNNQPPKGTSIVKW